MKTFEERLEAGLFQLVLKIDEPFILSAHS